jgi:hypothetical protein
MMSAAPMSSAVVLESAVSAAAKRGLFALALPGRVSSPARRVEPDPRTNPIVAPPCSLAPSVRIALASASDRRLASSTIWGYDKRRYQKEAWACPRFSCVSGKGEA